MPSDLVARYYFFFLKNVDSWRIVSSTTIATHHRCSLCVRFFLEDSCSYAGRRIKHTKNKDWYRVCPISKANQREKMCVSLFNGASTIPSEPTIFGVCCGVMHGAWRKLSWSIHNNKTKGIEILLSFACSQSKESNTHTHTHTKEKEQPASRS